MIDVNSGSVFGVLVEHHVVDTIIVQPAVAPNFCYSKIGSCSFATHVVGPSASRSDSPPLYEEMACFGQRYVMYA